MTASARNRTFAEAAAPYSPEVRQLARAARAFVLEVLPGAEEHVDTRGPYVSYGYGPGYKGMVATLILSKKGVKLGVIGGGSLPDPHGLLRGEGKVHRHIVLDTEADLRRRGVKEIVRAAHRAWRERTKASAPEREPGT